MNFRHLQKLSVCYNYNTFYRTARAPSPNHKPISTVPGPAESDPSPCVTNCLQPRSLTLPQTSGPCFCIRNISRINSVRHLPRPAAEKLSSGTRNVSKLSINSKGNGQISRSSKFKPEKLFGRKKIDRSSFTCFSERSTFIKKTKCNKHTEKVKLKKIFSEVSRILQEKYKPNQESNERFRLCLADTYVECIIPQHIPGSNKVADSHQKATLFDPPKTHLTVDNPLNQQRRYYSTKGSRIPIRSSKKRSRSPSVNVNHSRVFPPRKNIPGPAKDPEQPLVARKVSTDFNRKMETNSDNGDKDETQKLYFNNPDKVAKVENVSEIPEASSNNEATVPQQVKEDISTNKNYSRFPKTTFYSDGVHVEHIKEVVTKSVTKISEEEYLAAISKPPEIQQEGEYYRKLLSNKENSKEVDLKNIRTDASNENNITIEYKKRVSRTFNKLDKLATKKDKDGIKIPAAIYQLEGQEKKSAVELTPKKEKKHVNITVIKPPKNIVNNENLTVLATPKNEEMKTEIATKTSSIQEKTEIDYDTIDFKYCKEVLKELETKFNLEVTPINEELEKKVKAADKEIHFYLKNSKPVTDKLDIDLVCQQIDSKQDSKINKHPWEMSSSNLNSKLYNKLNSKSKNLDPVNDNISNIEKLEVKANTANNKLNLEFPEKTKETTTNNSCKPEFYEYKPKIKTELINSLHFEEFYPWKSYEKNQEFTNTHNAVTAKSVKLHFEDCYPWSSSNTNQKSSNKQNADTARTKEKYDNPNKKYEAIDENLRLFYGSASQKQFENSFSKTFIEEKLFTSAFTKTNAANGNLEKFTKDATKCVDHKEKRSLQEVAVKDVNESKDLSFRKNSYIPKISSTIINISNNLPIVDASKTERKELIQFSDKRDETKKKPLGILNITLNVLQSKQPTLEPLFFKSKAIMQKILRFEEYKKQFLELESKKPSKLEPKKSIGTLTVLLNPLKKSQTIQEDFSELSKIEKICKEELLALHSNEILNHNTTPGNAIKLPHEDHKQANFSQYVQESQSNQNINKASLEINSEQNSIRLFSNKPEDSSAKNSNNLKNIQTTVDKEWSQIKLEANKTVEEIENSKTSDVHNKNRMFVDAQTKQLNSITNLRSKAVKHLEENYKHSTKDQLEIKKADISSMVEEKISTPVYNPRVITTIIIQSRKSSLSSTANKFIRGQNRSTTNLEDLNVLKPASYSTCDKDKCAKYERTKDDPFGRKKPDPYKHKQRKMCPRPKPIDLRVNMKASDCCKKPDPCNDPCKKLSPCEPDPCKQKSTSSCSSKEKSSPCKKKSKCDQDPCKKKSTSSCSSKEKSSPCKKKSKCDQDPCKKKSTSSCSSKKKSSPCKKKSKCDQDPCKKKSTSSRCSKKKSSPCKKKSKCDQDPCKKKSSSSCSKPKKFNPCKGSGAPKKSCCPKEKSESPCEKPRKCKSAPRKTAVKKGIKRCCGSKKPQKKKNTCDPCKKKSVCSKKSSSCSPCKQKSTCRPSKKKPSRSCRKKLSTCSPCKKKPSNPCKKKVAKPCKRKPSKCCRKSSTNDKLKQMCKGPNTKNKIQKELEDPCILPKNKVKEKVKNSCQKAKKASPCKMAKKASPCKMARKKIPCKMKKCNEKVVKKKSSAKVLPKPVCGKPEIKETKPTEPKKDTKPECCKKTPSGSSSGCSSASKTSCKVSNKPSFAAYKAAPRNVCSACCVRHTTSCKSSCSVVLSVGKSKKVKFPSPKCTSAPGAGNTSTLCCCSKRTTGKSNKPISVSAGCPPMYGEMIINRQIGLEECDPPNYGNTPSKKKIKCQIDVTKKPTKKDCSSSTNKKSFSTKSSPKSVCNCKATSVHKWKKIKKPCSKCGAKAQTVCKCNTKPKSQSKTDPKCEHDECSFKCIPTDMSSTKFRSRRCLPYPKPQIISPCASQPKIPTPESPTCMRRPKTCSSKPNLYTRDDVLRCESPYRPSKIYKVHNTQYRILGPKLVKDSFSKLCRIKPGHKKCTETDNKKIVCNDCKKCSDPAKREVNVKYVQQMEEMIETKQCLSHHAMKHIPSVTSKRKQKKPIYLEILKRFQAEPTTPEAYSPCKKRSGSVTKNTCCNPKRKSSVCDNSNKI